MIAIDALLGLACSKISGVTEMSTVLIKVWSNRAKITFCVLLKVSISCTADYFQELTTVFILKT